ncbi:MAG: methyl-accepting chemotaxis protein [Selenomonadaceae bacterium]|nr:methyl-accepting chemotaxis protein [Selenomonadaceae bacterium]
MNLQKKSMLFFDALLLIACVFLVFLGYRSANEGFAVALENKAKADIRQTLEILDLSYPGQWRVEGGKIYKGEQLLNDANNVVDKIGKLTGNNVTIFAGDTRVATTFQSNGKRSTGTKASQPVIDTVITGGKNFVGEAEVLGNKYFCGYEPIKDTSGKVIGMLFMGVPKAEVERLQSSFLTSTITSTVVLIIVFGIIVLGFLRVSLKPLEEVETAMQKMAKGDLSAPPLVVKGTDEIGRMADAANHLQSSMAGILKEIVDSAQQLAAASEQLTASSQSTAESINQVSQNIQTIAEETESQSSTLGDINHTADDLKNDMTELHTSSTSMKHAADRSREGAKEGHAAVANSMNAMAKMATQMTASSKVVETLGERSKEIGNIVEAISGIAEQTNLLALNAAIEAARAGEAGRGFAVVADEVRKLAEQSGTAAQNISAIITGIQDDTAHAMQAMEKGNEEVQAGTKIVEKTGEVFSAMEKHIDTLYSQIQQSLSRMAAAEQATAKITSSIQEASSFSRDMANNAQSVSAATEEQAAMINDITDASESLANLAQQLQNDVTKFRLSR